MCTLLEREALSLFLPIPLRTTHSGICVTQKTQPCFSIYIAYVWIFKTNILDHLFTVVIMKIVSNAVLPFCHDKLKYHSLHLLSVLFLPLAILNYKLFESKALKCSNSGSVVTSVNKLTLSYISPKYSQWWNSALSLLALCSFKQACVPKPCYIHGSLSKCGASRSETSNNRRGGVWG